MRISKLLGVLFLVLAVFTATRGPGWHFGYVALGVFLGFLGLLLVSARRVHRFRVTRPRRGIAARPGRNRIVPAPAK